MIHVYYYESFIGYLLFAENLKMASSKLEYLKRYMSKEDNNDSSVKKKKKKKRTKDPGG